MNTQPPQTMFDMKAIAEHVFHTKRRNGEDTTEAKMLLGAVTAAIGATMFFNAFMAKRGGEQTEKTWAALASNGGFTSRGVG